MEKKNLIIALAQKIGVWKKIQDKSATNDDYQAFAAALKTEQNLTIVEATEILNAADEGGEPTSSGEPAESTFTAEDSAALAASFAAIQAALPNGGEPTPQASGEPTPTGEPTPQASGEPTPQASPEIAQLTAGVNKLVGVVATLSGKPEGDNPQTVAAAKPTIMLCGPGTNTKHLFGIQHDMFSLAKPWNANAASRIKRTDLYSEEEKTELFSEFRGYASNFSKRVSELQTTGQLATMLAGNMDYSSLESELGAYYQVRRMDALITFITKLESAPFPIRYNVQDEEVITNSFHGRSYSQAYQSGRVFAGGFKFTPDKAKVKDIMFKFMFSDLKDLEREYIGYLNNEGSDPIKWTFIEWILRQCAVLQHNEKEERRISGVRIDPTPTKASFFKYGSDGILTMLDDRCENKPSIYRFADYKAFSPATILEYVESFVREVHMLRGKRGGIKNMKLCLNDLYVTDLLKAHRKAYGKDNDFNGEKLEVKPFQALPNIIRVPNMGPNNFAMWMMESDAIEIHENKPGEYFSYYFQRDFEQLFVMSYGKEGVYCFSGKKYTTPAEMLASKGKVTNIFMNNPVTPLAADATTADGMLNVMFESAANTGATALTDIDNAEEGELYKFVCGSLTNPTGIAKADKFANITEAWIPTAVGDYIKVIYDPTEDEFLEYERKVGGTITRNTNLKAPEYVEQTV